VNQIKYYGDTIMNKLLGVALLSAILLGGCGESTAKEVKSETQTPKMTKSEPTKAPATTKAEPKKEAVEVKAAPKAEVSKFYTIFKDAAKIATDGKEMLLLFGQDSDPYTQKIKDDIVSDEALAAKISETVTPVYVDARGQLQHKFQHNGEMMDVDTKTLISIYNVSATPTLIFTDSEAGHIFVVPGYMSPKQFKATLDFVKEKLWKGKDRKNGDVYAALKKYYAEHGVEVKGAKK
jgi:thioredoxin-related protein